MGDVRPDEKHKFGFVGDRGAKMPNIVQYLSSVGPLELTGVGGFLCYLFAFGAVQFGFLDGNSAIYSMANIAAAVMVSVMHIDRNCKGGPAQGTAGHGIDHGDISLGMIDLNDIQRVLHCKGAGCSQVTAFRFVLTLPLGHELGLIVSLQPSSQTPNRGWGQP